MRRDARSVVDPSLSRVDTMRIVFQSEFRVDGDAPQLFHKVTFHWMNSDRFLLADGTLQLMVIFAATLEITGIREIDIFTLF